MATENYDKLKKACQAEPGDGPNPYELAFSKLTEQEIKALKTY